jgi:hypothetical protein
VAVTIQLMYHSHATEEFSTDDLLKLLFDARIYNHSHQISGLLLHSKGEFLQVLEGEPEYVDELFEKISRDYRHERVTLFQRKEIKQREFVQWAMGFENLSETSKQKIHGFSNFLEDDHQQLDDSMFSHDAKRLILCFKTLQKSA